MIHLKPFKYTFSPPCKILLIVENWGYVIKKGIQSFKEQMQVQKLLIESMQSIGQLVGIVNFKKKDLVFAGTSWAMGP